MPPMLVRALARQGHGLKPMSNLDIAEASGLSTNTIVRLSRLRTWDDVTVRVLDGFSRACGVNLEAPRRQIEFWRRRALAYMVRANPRQKMMYARIMSELTNGATAPRTTE